MIQVQLDMISCIPFKLALYKLQQVGVKMGINVSY